MSGGPSRLRTLDWRAVLVAGVTLVFVDLLLGFVSGATAASVNTVLAWSAARVALQAAILCILVVRQPSGGWFHAMLAAVCAYAMASGTGLIMRAAMSLPAQASLLIAVMDAALMTVSLLLGVLGGWWVRRYLRTNGTKVRDRSGGAMP